MPGRPYLPGYHLFVCFVVVCAEVSRGRVCVYTVCLYVLFIQAAVGASSWGRGQVKTRKESGLELGGFFGHDILGYYQEVYPVAAQGISAYG